MQLSVIGAILCFFKTILRTLFITLRTEWESSKLCGVCKCIFLMLCSIDFMLLILIIHSFDIVA